MDDSLIERIGAITAPMCAQCSGELGDSVSDDFCSPECQAAWVAHRNAVQELTGYREPMGGWHGDAMVVRDGEVEHPHQALTGVWADLREQIEREMREVDDLLRESEALRRRSQTVRWRSRRRMWRTIGAILGLELTNQAIIWGIGGAWSLVSTGLFLVAVVVMTAHGVCAGKRERRELLPKADGEAS